MEYFHLMNAVAVVQQQFILFKFILISKGKHCIQFKTNLINNNSTLIIIIKIYLETCKIIL